MISFEPFFQYLKENKIKKKTFLKEGVVGATSMDRMRAGKNIILSSVEKICLYYNIPIERVIKFVDEDGSEPTRISPESIPVEEVLQEKEEEAGKDYDKQFEHLYWKSMYHKDELLIDYEPLHKVLKGMNLFKNTNMKKFFEIHQDSATRIRFGRYVKYPVIEQIASRLNVRPRNLVVIKGYEYLCQKPVEEVVINQDPFEGCSEELMWVLDEPLEVLGLPVRTKNVLLNNGLKSIKDVITLETVRSSGELAFNGKELVCFGKSTRERSREVLDKWGLTFDTKRFSNEQLRRLIHMINIATNLDPGTVDIYGIRPYDLEKKQYARFNVSYEKLWKRMESESMARVQREAGLGKNYFYKLKSGETVKMKWDSLVKVANVLNVRPVDLFDIKKR